MKKCGVFFTKSQVCVLGVFWFFMAIFWRQHEVPAPLASITLVPSSILLFSYRCVCPFFGSLFFMGLFFNYIKANSSWAIKNLVYLGKISLGIYMIHFFVKNCLGEWYLNLYDSNESFVFVLVDFLIKLLSSILLTYFIEQSQWLSLLLLGNNKFNYGRNTIQAG